MPSTVCDFIKEAEPQALGSRSGLGNRELVSLKRSGDMYSKDMRDDASIIFYLPDSD